MIVDFMRNMEVCAAEPTFHENRKACSVISHRSFISTNSPSIGPKFRYQKQGVNIKF